MYLKISSAKQQPFCAGGDELFQDELMDKDISYNKAWRWIMLSFLVILKQATITDAGSC